jgi:adenosylcobinamide-phosphate synthase
MSFLCVLAALSLEQLRPLAHPSVLELSFTRYAGRLARDLNAGRLVHGTIGWLVGVLPWVALTLVVHYLLSALGPLFGWGWAVAVLYACIDFKPMLSDYSAIIEALRAGELERARELVGRWRSESAAQYSESDVARVAIESALLRAHRDLLAVVAWFVVLPGPAGAVLYKLSAMLVDEWGRRADEDFQAFGQFSSRVLRVLDWIPVRLTAIGFAIAGDLEDALQCWRTQPSAWSDPELGIVLASGAGALGVRLGGPLPRAADVDYRAQLGTGDEPDTNYMQSAVGLIWRTLVIGMIVLLLVTLARWVGI